MVSKDETIQPLINSNASNPITLDKVPSLHYNPYQTPADHKAAQNYLIATRIARPILKKNQIIDPASGLPIYNEQISLLAHPNSLSFLSPGYPLYFQYVKFVILILVTIFLTSNGHALYAFYTGDLSKIIKEETLQAKVNAASQMQSGSLNSIINRFTMKNMQYDVHTLITVVVLVFMLQIIRKIQKERALECDEREITASDFTARVTGLPTDFTDEQDIDEEIAKFFTENGVPGRKLNVASVSACYDCSQKIKSKEALKELYQKKAKLIAKKESKISISDKDIEDIDEKIKETNQKVLKASEMFEDGKGVAKYFEGEAYISFETQEELQLVLKHWNMGRIKQLTNYLKNDSVYKFNGKLLKVVQAPEPSDVYWENAGIPWEKLYKIRLWGAFKTALILFQSLAVFYFVDINKKYIMGVFDWLHESRLGSASEIEKSVWRAVLFFINEIAILVTITVNGMLEGKITSLAEKERYGTYTEFESHVATRTLISKFINTAILPLIIALISNNLERLASTIFVMKIISAMRGWGHTIINTKYISYYKLKSKYSKKEHPMISQEQLNKVYRFPECRFGKKYAGYTTNLLVTSFFASLSPAVLIVAIMDISVQYCFDKVIALRLSSRGPAVGSELSSEFIENMEYCLIMFSLGTLLFDVQVGGLKLTENYLAIIGLAISLANTFLPMRKINDVLFPLRDEKVTDDKFGLMKKDFSEDYKRKNPATEDIANEEFIVEKEKAAK